MISVRLLSESKPGEVMRVLFTSGAMLLLSRVTFLELASRLARSKFDRYRTTGQMNSYLDWLADLAERVKPSIRITDCPDPDDNSFLELLVAGEGDLLITGDKDLRALSPYESRPINYTGCLPVKVLTVNEFHAWP